MKYRTEIDGLRALAVISVILYHAGFDFFKGGFIGVDVFFVISGYLITNIIITEKEAGTFSLINFYERRARRILPALFLVILVFLPFAILYLSPADLKRFSQSVVAVNIFSSNILFFLTSGYFDTQTELKPLIHTWSLAVEEQFYIIFPLFLMLSWKLGKKWIAILLIIFAFASLAIMQFESIFLNPFKSLAFKFYLLPARAWEIIIGALIAFYYAKKNITKHKYIFGEIGSSIGIVLIIYAIFNFDKHTPLGLYNLMPTLGAALIIIFATNQTKVGKILGSKLFFSIGLISYGAYLWHQPLFAFAKYTNLEKPSYSLMTTLSIVSIVLAYFSWKYVERPFRNKHFFNRKQIFLYSTMIVLILLSLSTVGILSNGLLFRYVGNDKDLAKVQFTKQSEIDDQDFMAKYHLKNFSSLDNRKKILIIGDSFAEDLIEALFKSGIAQKIQISTRHIKSHCGNLFIEQKIISNYRGKDSHWSCKKENGIYADADLRKIMSSADEIWFVSEWLQQSWGVPLLQRSVKNVEMLTSKKVKVFGPKNFGTNPKNFGTSKISHLLKINESERIHLQSFIDKKFIEINKSIKNNLSSHIFIDTQILLCGDQINVCRIFNDEGKIISHDGLHLTKYGAQLFGQKLKELNLIED